MVSKGAGKGKRGRESFWREKLSQWWESGQSQAAFCREHGLGENSFSHWKMVIAERDSKGKSEKSGSNIELKGIDEPHMKEAEVNASAPTFVRLGIAGCRDAEEVEADERGSKESSSQPIIAAEIVDAGSGRRLRIFNGADQVTVATLLSVLSSV
jgi:hypothetical protein